MMLAYWDHNWKHKWNDFEGYQCTLSRSSIDATVQGHCALHLIGLKIGTVNWIFFVCEWPCSLYEEQVTWTCDWSLVRSWWSWSASVWKNNGTKQCILLHHVCSFWYAPRQNWKLCAVRFKHKLRWPEQISSAKNYDTPPMWLDRVLNTPVLELSVKQPEAPGPYMIKLEDETCFSKKTVISSTMEQTEPSNGFWGGVTSRRRLQSEFKVFWLNKKSRMKADSVVWPSHDLKEEDVLDDVTPASSTLFPDESEDTFSIVLHEMKSACIVTNVGF